MLELPLLQASGCCVSYAATVLALPQPRTPCQGLLAASSSTSPFESACA
jgi:hypothetical protein